MVLVLKGPKLQETVQVWLLLINLTEAETAHGRSNVVFKPYGFQWWVCIVGGPLSET